MYKLALSLSIYKIDNRFMQSDSQKKITIIVVYAVQFVMVTEHNIKTTTKTSQNGHVSIFIVVK